MIKSFGKIFIVPSVNGIARHGVNFVENYIKFFECEFFKQDLNDPKSLWRNKYP